MRKKAALVHLGCPKNQVDGEVMAGFLLDKYDITEQTEQADVIIINTCAFIESAKTEAIDTIYEMLQLKEKDRSKKVIVTGCLAQRYGEEVFAEVPELDGVFGDGVLPRICEDIACIDRGERLFIPGGKRDFIYSHEMPRKRVDPGHFAYVKVAEGCDNHCSYCAIPLIKGPYRSRSLASIDAEVRGLAEDGVKEIALVAQDTTRYGLDLYGKLMLPDLLRQLAQIEGIFWIRLLYCYPERVTEELIQVIKQEEKICPYMDLPLQHSHDDMLRAMKRRNTEAEAVELIKRLRTEIPGIFLRTTFITGFPGETEEQFAHLLRFVEEMKFDRVGAFAYSQEEGTEAGERSDQILPEVRESRKQQLLDLQTEIVLEKQLMRVGQVLPVILEEQLGSNYWQARSQGDAPETDGQVLVTTKVSHVKGTILPVLIRRADSFDLQGEEVHEPAK